MTASFNKTAMTIYKDIRKSMPPPVKRIASKKDKIKKEDIKKGRKDWRNYD